MRTIQPTVVRGRSGYRPEVVDVAELERRRARVQRWLADNDLDAALLYGDPMDYERLHHLTGMVPMSRWALAVVPRSGPLVLLVAVSGPRDLPFMKTLAAVADVRSVADVGGQIDELVPGPERSIALLDSPGMRSAVYRTLVAVDGVQVVDRGALDHLVHSLSPADLAALRRARSLTDAAAATVAQSFLAGVDPSSALIEGELAAREAGAHDVRMVVSLDGARTMRPFERLFTAESLSLPFYLAVEDGGYWSQTFRTVVRGEPGPLADEVAAVLDDAEAAVRAGSSVADVIGILRQPARSGVSHPVLAGHEVVAMGLRSEGRTIEAADGPLPEGLYSLRAGRLPEAGRPGVLASREVDTGRGSA